MTGYAYGPTKINGSDAPYASIEVRVASSGALASITDRTGATLANPFQADEYGVYGFSADAGTYDVTATAGAVSNTVQVTIISVSQDAPRSSFMAFLAQPRVKSGATSSLNRSEFILATMNP